MSAIVTRSGRDSPRGDIRPLSLWNGTINEVTPCLCGNDDCMYQYIFENGLFKSNATMERQRFNKTPMTKEKTMQKFIMNELIDTERSYNQLLQLIYTKYMQPMIKEATKSKSLVKSSQIPLLFEYLPELLELSNDLLDSIKQNPDQLGSLFQVAQPRFLVFMKYTKHYKFNEKAIRKACKNILFIKIDQECLSRRDTKRLGMFDYFIAPIQRITRYCLLIQDLQKYTKPSSTELDNALIQMKDLATKMDNI